MKIFTSFFKNSFQILLLFFFLFTSASSVFGAMSEYCVSPPFVSQSIPPNIMIVLDNSGSMCFQAYAGGYNPSQFTNGLYYGYFEGNKNYRYNGSRWEATTAAMNTGTAAYPIATGSFLNWATMRRTEVSKRLLIGGKSDRPAVVGQTVRLYGENPCQERSFSKNFNTSAGNLIYPFVGDYKFARGNNAILSLTRNSDFTIYTVRPNAGITPITNNTSDWVAQGWSEYPDDGNPVAHTKVAEVSSDEDATYIKNTNSTNPVIMDFNYANAEPAAGEPLGAIKVEVYIRAKSNTPNTRRINAILRVDGVDYASAAENITSGYNTYSMEWATNPKTNSAWTWDQIKQIATSGGGNLDGFGLKAAQAYLSSTSIRVTQVYMTASVTTPTGGPFNIIVDQGTTAATGLIHALDPEVRFGLGYYNGEQGGRIQNYVEYNTPSSMITSINALIPSTWTPLGETLHEMVRYFRQDAPYYNTGDYTKGSGVFTGTEIYKDPYAYKFTDVDPSLTNMYVQCAKSFILFLTDGESTKDTDVPSSLRGASAGVMPAPNPASSRFAGTTVGVTYPPDDGTDYMIDVAYWARTNDMRPGACSTVPTSWNQCLPGTQNVFLYPIFMFGTGSSLLKDAAIYGGFNDIKDTTGAYNNKPDCTTRPAECYKDSDLDGTVESNGDDLPLTYYEGNDGYALEQNIKTAIYDIVKRAASSTAVSVLSSSEGSGANLVQSLFYPKRSFSNSADITWTSDLMNYWYYMDPYFRSSQIREDTIRDNSAYTLLDLKTDYISQFYFDSAQQKTLSARCQDTDGDGDCDDTSVGNLPIEDAKAIWRAGINLWLMTPADRNIKTSVDGSTLIPFDTTNTAILDDYLGQTTNTSVANATINYVRGTDQGKLCTVSRALCSSDTDCGASGGLCVATRSRTAPMKVCTASKMPCNIATDCTIAGVSDTCVEETHTWKLGDVISSTPRIMGPSPLNNYNNLPPIGYGDTTYKDFIASASYKERQRVFVGSNDGMFHAFRLGKVMQKWEGKEWWQPGRLEGATGAGGIGTESWAFIPKNVLPYLQHLSQPDYCHIYMVDGPVFLTDVSIKCSPADSGCTTETDYWKHAKQDSTWSTIAIGSMGIGGATSDVVDTDCVKTPIVVNEGGVSKAVGWSSYFALDVTTQDTPQLLWEFSNPDLGVTNVGPAIIKVGNEKRCIANNATCSTDSNCTTGDKCVQANGRWFAILPSGSTGPITAKDFKGTSDQTLKLFVLDLKTGALLRTIDTGITNAFAGSIASNSVDLEKSNKGNVGNYQDDVVYIGYVKDTLNGGVLRLVINDDIDPAHWTTSKVIDGIGPVTTSVANLLDRKSNKLWLYFAEGRYFYKQDDLASQRKLFGVQDPCYVDDSTTTVIDYNVLPGCSTSLALTSLKDQTTAPSALTSAQKGWYVKLDPETSTAGAERVISNPTPDTLGAIFFLSFAPTSDICGFGGTTYLWALDYSSGGKVNYTMQGKALVQVSTGEIKEIDLSDSNTFNTKDLRRTVGFQGIPPTGQGLMVVKNPDPIKKFMHVQEQ
jgi:type IV pilus assembly protein PilY1